MSPTRKTQAQEQGDNQKPRTKKRRLQKKISSLDLQLPVEKVVDIRNTDIYKKMFYQTQTGNSPNKASEKPPGEPWELYENRFSMFQEYCSSKTPVEQISNRITQDDSHTTKIKNL